MQTRAPDIFYEHPHFTAEETFVPQIRQICGFIEKDYSIGLHSQGFYEINIVLGGVARHYIGKSIMTVGVGDTFIIPPDVMHGYDGGEGFDVYHLLINPKYLEKHSTQLQLLPAFSAFFRIDPLMRERASANLHFCLDKSDVESVWPRLERIISYSRTDETVSCIAADGEALALIAELCGIYERYAGSSGVSLGDDRDFLASISYLYEHYNEKITIDDLARIARMSRNSYIAAFKRTTGQTPAKFLRSYRVDMAKQMLRETRMSVAEIASAVGCGDTSHLIKIFSSETGTTPSAFRKSSAANNF